MIDQALNDPFPVVAIPFLNCRRGSVVSGFAEGAVAVSL